MFVGDEVNFGYNGTRG